MSAIQLTMDDEFDDLLISKIKKVANELNISFNKLLTILAAKMSSIKGIIIDEDTLFKEFSIKKAMVGIEDEDFPEYSVKDIKEFF